MVRGKIEIKRIENVTSRQVTFSKRRKGLMKKAHELSVLCDAQVAAIVFSQKGKLYDFSSSDMKQMIERCQLYKREYFTAERLQEEKYVQNLKNEIVIMVDKIEHLQLHCRKLMGQDLNSCSVEELQKITTQIEKSLSIVRSRKDKLNEDEIGKLKAEIAGKRELLDEKTRLHEMESNSLSFQFEEKPLLMQSKSLESEKSATSFGKRNMNISDVETDLIIGLPKSRMQ